jgi:hypothetical protein
VEKFVPFAELRSSEDIGSGGGKVRTGLSKLPERREKKSR